MTIFEYPLIVSSSSNAGAINKSADGSYFEVNFDHSLEIPTKADMVQCELRSATIWNTVYNISASLGNNNFRYIDTSGPTNYDVVIPDGLYNLDTLSERINQELVNQGLASGIIDFVPDNASQKVVIEFTQANQRVDFTIANSVRLIMGFDSRLSPLAGATTAAEFDTGDDQAAFNSTDSFQIHSDLVQQGVPSNGTFRQILAPVLITSPPGTQIVYEPRHPLRVSLEDKIGAKLKKLSFWLTDQNSDRVDTAGEDWACSLVIRYTMGPSE